MNYATPEAIENIAAFTSDKTEQETIDLFLSEEPIGDEYQVLPEGGWELGQRYVAWLEGRGITAFKEQNVTELYGR